MPKLITEDEDGNTVETEIDYTLDQIEGFKNQAEESVIRLAEVEKGIAEKEEQLQKLKEKDLNFSRFRERSEEEKKKWEEGLKGDVKGVYEELQVLKKERGEEKTRKFESAKKAILMQLAGDDEDLKKSIQAKSSDFAGEAVTEEELERRYRQAYTLIKEERPKPNPLYEVRPIGNFGDPNDKPVDYVKTERGKEAFETLFGHKPLSAEEIKKFNK